MRRRTEYLNTWFDTRGNISDGGTQTMKADDFNGLLNTSRPRRSATWRLLRNSELLKNSHTVLFREQLCP